ncbi:MAG: hypothetical protein QM767_28215, partial [Anaeromyxobacter sp.]
TGHPAIRVNNSPPAASTLNRFALSTMDFLKLHGWQDAALSHRHLDQGHPRGGLAVGRPLLFPPPPRAWRFRPVDQTDTQERSALLHSAIKKKPADGALAAVFERFLHTRGTPKPHR